MTKLADRITEGECKIYEGTFPIGETGDHESLMNIEVSELTIAQMVEQGLDGEYDEMKANAELIAEAFNVTHKTGKSPKELQEERDEAVRLLNGLYRQIQIDDGWNIPDINDFLNKLKPDSTH